MDQKVLAIVPSVSKPAVGDVNEDMDWQQIQSSHSSDRLLTNELRHRRGICASTSCILCGNGVESTLHVLGDCSYASSFWRIFAPAERRSDFFGSSLVNRL